MASRSPVALLALILSLTACQRPASTAPEAGFDLVFRDALVVDGTGAPARRADVAVRDGEIAEVGRVRDSVAAGRAIDASGLVLAPGFVDVHSHADLILLADGPTQQRLLAAKILQGVTTVIVGNCGLGVAPVSEAAADVLADVNGWMTPAGVRQSPLSVRGFLDRLETAGVAVNVGTLVPHGAVRVSAMGLAAGAPSPDQLRAMRKTVARGLDEGALGLSAGLIYPPGMYADTDELVELARVVAERDRLFTCHVRGSSQTLVPATRELIEIARRSGARVHHSHLEAVGERFWPDVARVLALEDEARAEGLRISHDVFPYTRAATMMSAIFPPWSLEGGLPALIERLGDPAVSERIRREVETRVPEWPPWRPGGWPHNLVEAVGWDGIIVASVGPGGPAEVVGRSLASLARERDGDPFDVVSALMISEGGQVGQQVDEISGKSERLDVLASILSHRASAVISDAEDYGRGSPHPAHAGAFARVLRMARENGLMSLEAAVRKMTSYPASLVGLRERGVIREGAVADLVAFDPARVADDATWDEPRRPAVGVRWVVIGGRLAVEDGVYRHGLPGRVIRSRS